MLNVQERSLNWALDHAIEDGDTDLLPTPFEYEAIKHSWEEIREHLSEIDILKHNTRVQRHILAPKSRYGFRTITQLDPFDFLLYTAIVYEIGEDLESRRVDKGDEVVFSYRFPHPMMEKCLMKNITTNLSLIRPMKLSMINHLNML